LPIYLECDGHNGVGLVVIMEQEQQKPVATNNSRIDEHLLFEQVVKIIENCKRQAGSFANQAITLTYWKIGAYIGSVLLGGERAKYGKHIVVTLSHRLIGTCDRVFEYTKIPRMIKFAELFPDVEILAMLSQELSWSHFIEILPLKSPE
jgi:effector-binding domain-containing protein